jgi:hypothetical protein
MHMFLIQFKDSFNFQIVGFVAFRRISNLVPDRGRHDEPPRGRAVGGRQLGRHLQHLVHASIQDGRHRQVGFHNCVILFYSRWES